MMATKIVFLFDVDNTLLDNDAVAADLRDYLLRTVGHDRCERYWTIFESLRNLVGYADYLGALQQYRADYPHSMKVLSVSDFLINYPFPARLLPKALDVVAAANQHGKAVILSDGDVVFQPLKIKRSGLFQAVQGNALLYVHKENELADVAERYPADHYVFVDDKLRLLDAVKKIWGEKVTTVFPRQGHYALDPEIVAQYPAADVTIEQIGDLLPFFVNFGSSS
jgi:phosphoglycolate phosphatase-like HAD superfamily hydrolase